MEDGSNPPWTNQYQLEHKIGQRGLEPVPKNFGRHLAERWEVWRLDAGYPVPDVGRSDQLSNWKIERLENLAESLKLRPTQQSYEMSRCAAI